MVRLRKPLPPYALKTPEGGKVYLPDLKGMPLVLLRSEALAQGLAAREAELKALGAQAYLLTQAPRPSPLPLLLDPEGALLGAIPEGGVLVADAFLEVYHLGPVRDEEEVLEWLRFVEAQCPECVLPEADWF
ncbi:MULTISPECIES: hypothetical protein [Thermus]|uniref:Uncharacterized protein n=2 Tax=Thermus TaxID=270 RepID=A0A430S237_THESC|nr:MULTISPECIES: hypothetical protein [Thermus]AFH40139.1 hypothetical protein TtJL18_2309 [Thermus thermophilus JL-18]RTH27590.1 hypothetical protein CSW40_02575 [Thermus scotoductus]RTI41862.1 hypothetical protein CSW18_02525 [Thermus scotoductus]